MAQSPFKTPEFLILFEKWNTILQDSGFKDAEDFRGNTPTLKDWLGTNWQNISLEKRDDLQRYYEMATDILNTFSFKNKSHKRIWSLHCEGLSIRKIAHLLKRKKTSVHTIILAIEAEAGLKRG